MKPFAPRITTFSVTEDHLFLHWAWSPSLVRQARRVNQSVNRCLRQARRRFDTHFARGCAPSSAILAALGRPWPRKGLHEADYLDSPAHRRWAERRGATALEGRDPLR